ncbi:2-oxoglutarate receptor 1 [Alligator mississippiensis]|uniref:2-oxoglutarate receptor 1 n=1 Tax=Alligator mississippiensis TaxID=8496 RepID=UPI0003D08694|nr:2-oxoglutarate receptor 1 [Alligator mississippiensis]XP_019342488.1 2-oxoglutarate receptor 1 [Alligator mississippiensis]
MNMTAEDLANFTTLPIQANSFINCTEEDFLLMKYYISAFYGIIFVLCFPVNIVVIFMYFFKMRPWKSSTIIMLNLAITDLFYLTTLPFLIHYFANGNNWIFGNVMCKFIMFNFYFNMYSSILFLCCFSIFRYIVVLYPINWIFVHKKKWAMMACIVVWVISLGAVSPLGFLITTKKKQNRTICMDLTNVTNLNASWWYNLLLTVFAFLLPLLIVTLCYSAIIYTLDKGPNNRTSYKQKARKLAILILAVFYVCFLPFHIFRGVRIELQLYPVSCPIKTQILGIFTATKPLAALNVVGNLLLYVVMGGNFQRAVLSVLKFRTKKKSELERQ